MKMKRILTVLLCVVLLAEGMTGCGSAPAKYTAPADTEAQPGAEKLRITATIFPVYDWLRQIVGDHGSGAELTLLLGNGVDLHSYQPTADDIVTIASCDLFVYVGGESDEWVEDVLREASNKDITAIDLLDVLGDRAKAEEYKDGMQTEPAEEVDEASDEHIWLSLKNASTLCRCLAEKLCELDPDHADAYRANTDAYTEKLDALDQQYAEAAAAAPVKTLLFGDRFPFRYLTDDYGLDYYAAFAGCSAESEASFETVIFLAEKIDALGLKAILQLENADGKLAETIKNQTQSKDQAILTLNSLQSMTEEDIAGGLTYLSAMEKNLAVLKNAMK